MYFTTYHIDLEMQKQRFFAKLIKLLQAFMSHLPRPTPYCNILLIQESLRLNVLLINLACKRNITSMDLADKMQIKGYCLLANIFWCGSSCILYI